jgi:hypothetical protein
MLTIYKMLVVRNSNKQIIYVLKMTISLMLSYFSSTYVHEKLFAIKNIIKSKEIKFMTCSINIRHIDSSY